MGRQDIPSPGRRRALWGLGGAGIVVAGGLVLRHGGAGPAAARDPRAEGPPRRGGVLRIAYADSPDTLDIHRTMSYVGRQISTLVYDGLTRLDAQDRPQPCLATKWWPEKDGEEWVFELRDGVRFHHGRMLSSADVVASIERMQDPQAAFSSVGSFGPVKSVAAEGPHRVRIVYRQRFGEAPIVVAGDHAGIVPADRVTTLGQHPTGTGAFLFKDFQPGSGVTLARNPDYWIADRPYLDGIEIRTIREPVAQQGALQAGDIDLVPMISPEAYLSLKGNSRLQTWSAPNGSHHVLLVEADRAPFDNPQVREAFRYLIDRDALVASALLGQGRVGGDVPFAPGTPFFPDIAPARQDLAKARQLLQAAGIDRLTLDLWTSSERPPAPKMALSFSQSAAPLGLTLQVRDIPYAEYVSSVARKKPLYTNYQGSWPTLYQSVYRAYRSGEGYNYGGREQFPGADAQLEDLVSTTEPALRQARARAVLAKISRFGERITPYFQNYMAAASPSVRGFVPPPYMMIDLQSVWLA
jgi:peptide/nickel transport system substrate-binding protein